MNVDDQKKTFQDVSVADGSIDETLGESAYIDLKAQKKLLLKLDLYLAPIITLIFLCAYLDRSNIGLRKLLVWVTAWAWSAINMAVSRLTIAMFSP